MPHTLGEIFAHAQYQISKTATAAGRGQRVRRSSRAQPSPIERPALLQAAAETTACGADQPAKKT